MRRLAAPRSLVLAAVVAVLVVLISSAGSQRPAIAADGAMRQLQPKMRAVHVARSSCASASGRRACTAADIVSTPAARAIELRAGSACISPRAACVRVEGDVLVAEIVSRELPGIGGIRLEGVGHRTEATLRWTCHPVRGGSDQAIVRRACGDIPQG